MGACSSSPDKIPRALFDYRFDTLKAFCNNELPPTNIFEVLQTLTLCLEKIESSRTIEKAVDKGLVRMVLYVDKVGGKERYPNGELKDQAYLFLHSLMGEMLFKCTPTQVDQVVKGWAQMGANQSDLMHVMTFKGIIHTYLEEKTADPSRLLALFSFNNNCLIHSLVHAHQQIMDKHVTEIFKMIAEQVPSLAKPLCESLRKVLPIEHELMVYFNQAVALHQ